MREEEIELYGMRRLIKRISWEIVKWIFNTIITSLIVGIASGWILSRYDEWNENSRFVGALKEEISYNVRLAQMFNSTSTPIEFQLPRVCREFSGVGMFCIPRYGSQFVTTVADLQLSQHKNILSPKALLDTTAVIEDVRRQRELISDAVYAAIVGRIDVANDLFNSSFNMKQTLIQNGENAKQSLDVAYKSIRAFCWSKWCVLHH